MAFVLVTVGGPHDGEAAPEGFSTRDKAQKLVDYMRVIAPSARLAVEEQEDVPVLEDEDAALLTADVFARARGGTTA